MGLKPKRRAAHERHRELLGWLPPAGIDEYPAFGEAEQLPTEVARVWDGFDGAMWLLCGLVEIGRDPSGDTTWCSTLPSPAGTAAVYRYDRETGVLEAARSEGSEHPGWRDPLALFARSRWLLSFGAGHVAPGFAGDLGRAAPLAAWETERELLAEAPWLANYWLLAHFYLGNHRAAARAVDRGADSPAELTRQLAWAIDRALADESSGLLSVPASQVAELQAACARHARPALRECSAG